MSDGPTKVRIEPFEWPELETSPVGLRYARFRAMVYVMEQKFRDPDVLDLRGGETDAYDPVSRHFIAFADDTPKIIGCARTIHDPLGILPAEKYFPGVMGRADLDPTRCAEVSRFISRGPSMRSRRSVSLLLIRSLLLAGMNDGLDHVLFIVEEPFTKWLASLAIPSTRLAEYRLIPEEAGELAPIAVHIRDCDRVLAERHPIYAEAVARGTTRLEMALASTE